MSKISLKPNDSGTGVFTLEAPNSNSDRTLNLPDEAGTVLTNVSDIESQVKTATNATGSAPVYACRAWVNFDGTGTVSIRDSGNVSSITDNGIGRYIINFTSLMPDANYSISALVHNWDGSVGLVGPIAEISFFGGNTSLQDNSAEIRVFNLSDSPKDSFTVCASIFR